ncbi:hypothetical protein SJAG_04209 [Schizosaccharomyces japonicus yFS275]|uniref:Uncharacterized protein n=1 Tax=Schizosaccharomyces japonicus (strain yFS275 / FY16936) TaxID=402676 RepID=B6K681_SCHJY|nr:hypothetical protein SJAG_04209 [Schizosaccharomyces japonicus yFS275]EEB09035.1 hypothetical protein SJAG_04209 [Schizosaccharomyces japonicus yFS275]
MLALWVYAIAFLRLAVCILISPSTLSANALSLEERDVVLPGIPTPMVQKKDAESSTTARSTSFATTKGVYSTTETGWIIVTEITWFEEGTLGNVEHFFPLSISEYRPTSTYDVSSGSIGYATTTPTLRQLAESAVTSASSSINSAKSVLVFAAVVVSLVSFIVL